MTPERMQIRRYETQIRTLLDNLADNPSELSHWLGRDLHVIVLDPLKPTDLLNYETTRDRAVGMGIHTYPAFRTQPLSCRNVPHFRFAEYMTSDFWQTNATRLTNLAALRLPGDPWIGVDMENYAGVSDECRQLSPPARGEDGLEPTAEALADSRHQTPFTVAQLRAAMEPFIDAIRATNASVAIYPATAPTSEQLLHRRRKPSDKYLPSQSGEDLLYIAEALASERRVELWTEDTFDNSERYRKSSQLGWPIAAAEFLNLTGQLQARFPGCIVRPGIFDLERVWSNPYLLDLLRSGPAPWGFDWTRHDADDFGKPTYRAGLTLSKLNGATHVWPMRPLRTSVPIEFDTGSAPIELAQYGSQNTTDLKLLPTAIPNCDGIRFAAPPPPKPEDQDQLPLWVWAGLGGEFVLPKSLSAPFTVDGTLRLPADIPNSCPLFGGVWYNLSSWQVAYDHDRDVIALYVRNPHPTPSDPKRYTLDMMVAPPRGVDLRFQVGRDKTTWLYQVAKLPDGAVSGTRSDLPADAGGDGTHLLIGAGQAVADFPHINSMAYCPGILLVKTWSIYNWLLEKTELDALRKDTWLRPDHTTFSREGSWPYGYGRGSL